MNINKIGWIGLGKMGIPMSKRLIGAGLQVSVYNRSKDKEAMLTSIGADAVPNPAALIQQADVIILMVTDDQAVRDIFTGENGLLSANASGKLIINMSTISPGISKEMALLCEEKGNEYLDAPVSGSVKQAEEGQLVILAGGKQDVFEKAKPVLEQMGKLVVQLGDTGAGNTTKLAINTLLAFYAQGLAEMLVFAEKQRIDPAALMNFVNNGALGNIFSKLKADMIINEKYDAVFALKHIVKDLSLSAAEGFTTPLSQVTLQTFQAAEKEFGDEDIIAVFKYLQKNRG